VAASAESLDSCAASTSTFDSASATMLLCPDMAYVGSALRDKFQVSELTWGQVSVGAGVSSFEKAKVIGLWSVKIMKCLEYMPKVLDSRVDGEQFTVIRSIFLLR
jgi:hypothetical protein